MTNSNSEDAKVSYDDLSWLRSQEPSVMRLWFECVYAEKSGKSFKRLTSGLSRNSFSRAKKALEAKGLFEFKPITETTETGQYKIIYWEVKNLHGSENEEYWGQVGS